MCSSTFQFSVYPSIGWVFICPENSGQITFRPSTQVSAFCIIVVSLKICSLLLLYKLNDIVYSESWFFFCKLNNRQRVTETLPKVICHHTKLSAIARQQHTTTSPYFLFSLLWPGKLYRVVHSSSISHWHIQNRTYLVQKTVRPNQTIRSCQTDLMLVIMGTRRALGEMNTIRKPGRPKGSKDGPRRPDAQPRGRPKKTGYQRFSHLRFLSPAQLSACHICACVFFYWLRTIFTHTAAYRVFPSIGWVF